MAQGDRRKCKCCLKLFRPDPRNRRRQSYCSAPACKAASKAASQARWLAKGRVELGVGYVKKNFLRGLELTDFGAIQAAGQLWLDTIANVRIHGETQRRPADLLAREQPHLQPLNPRPYDIARTSACVASSQFRIVLDTNRYSVPAAYAHRRLTVKAYPDRVCISFDGKLIARHPRR